VCVSKVWECVCVIMCVGEVCVGVCVGGGGGGSVYVWVCV